MLDRITDAFALCKNICLFPDSVGKSLVNPFRLFRNFWKVLLSPLLPLTFRSGDSFVCSAKVLAALKGVAKGTSPSFLGSVLGIHDWAYVLEGSISRHSDPFSALSAQRVDVHDVKQHRAHCAVCSLVDPTTRDAIHASTSPSR